MKALFWRSQLLSFVCLFVCLFWCLYTCVCVCVCWRKDTCVSLLLFPPPLFFLLLFKDSSFWIACGFCSLPSTLSVLDFFFCLFSRRKDSFSFLAIVCVRVCVCCCCLRRGASKSLNGFFFPRCPLFHSPFLLRFLIFIFSFISFFFCFSVSLQSVAE